MSDSPHRLLFVTLASMLFAAAAFATTPSARFDARMVYNPVTTHTILFGGTTASDSSTKQAYEFNDTWDWNGSIWTQLFPLHVPPARYDHAMVYDSARDRIVMFGGRTGNGKVDLGDTWVFKNGDWTQLNPPNSPPARLFSSAAYDPLRDRVVLFGGATITADLKTTTPYHDTWEFDGTNWIQVLSDGPKVDKPILVWDGARANVFMLGVDSALATHQFTYDPKVPGWTENTKTRLPSCVNEANITYQSDSGTIFFTGGVCNGVSTVEDNEEWDGNQWNPKSVKTNIGRVYGPAMAFDESRQVTLLFGGNPVSSTTPRNQLWAFNGDWNDFVDPNLVPPARSLASFHTDLANNRILLFGGVDPTITYADLWQYQFGKWQRIVTNNVPPQQCTSPASAFDTNRHTLQVLCSDSGIHEFDGTDWKDFGSLTKIPPARLFSSMSYDENLKKTVLFGGYITDYINQTWTWDGTAWSQIEHDQPPQRASASMWFDPHLNRTVLFGGVGRAKTQDRVTRFNDMWQFDGTNWSEIKPAHVPPPRYGAQVAVDPRTNNTLLFGGLRVDTVTVPGTGNNPPTTTEVQVYADDFWQWDGKDWTQVTFGRTPYARENGGMAWDPSTQKMVIFGGYAGQQFLSDLWLLQSDNTWQPQITNVVRLRPVRR
jgi:hypothetical protein